METVADVGVWVFRLWPAMGEVIAVEMAVQINGLTVWPHMFN
jgi:hypothetical protein